MTLRLFSPVLLALLLCSSTPALAQDEDGDGYEPPADCDDSNPFIHPGAPELCNGLVDDDCDPATDELADVDEDGFNICQGDCDDAEELAHPDADEVCDGTDNDCDDEVDEDVDYDHDGWSGCDEDCDDYNPNAHPGNTEVPYDGIDQDCDGEDLTDIDGDGFDGGPYGDDCDDNDEAIHPGAEEICDDGIDGDCDGVSDNYDDDCVGGDDDTTGDDDTNEEGFEDSDPCWAFDSCSDGCSCKNRTGSEIPFTAGALLLSPLGLALRRRNH